MSDSAGFGQIRWWREERVCRPAIGDEARVHVPVSEGDEVYYIFNIYLKEIRDIFNIY